MTLALDVPFQPPAKSDSLKLSWRRCRKFGISPYDVVYAITSYPPDCCCTNESRLAAWRPWSIEIMVSGTFANVRLKNLLAPGTEGPVSVHLPDGEQMSIYDASVQYQAEGVPLLVLADKEYGSGSSRDWAAKGPRLLGVRAVIAQSYERIHRSNLVGMGILPLQFLPDQSPATLGLTGKETFDLTGLGEVLAEGFPRGKELTVRGARPDGSRLEFRATVRIDTPQELVYYRHGGILEYVLRQLRGSEA